ncbi:hypothetical protein BN85305140 [Paracholeplasma brassicae]|uniref:Uncharacterized protein n=1 Tax=Acholeplasma brassicae TaxID=61635 RepID=U4KMW5_9MOLU|nr:hypothetical protein BN85305140 [Paracholeplasma brassicae]
MPREHTVGESMRLQWIEFIFLEVLITPADAALKHSSAK